MSDVAGPFSANAAEILPPSAKIRQSASGRKTSRWLLLGSAVLLSAVIAGPSITSARAADSVENSETGPASGSPQASKSPHKAGIVASKKHRSAQTAKLHRMSLALNAQAADRPIPVADWRARTTDWTGFYAGIHAGLGTDTSSSSDTWNWLNSYPTGSIVGLN